MKKWTVSWVSLLVGVLTVASIGSAQTKKLTFWTWWSNPVLGVLNEAADKMGSEFEKKFPNIEIEVRDAPTGGAFQDRLITSIAGGSGPDVYFVDMYWAFDLFSKGLAVDLTPFIEREGIDVNAYWPGLVEQWTGPNGAIYGLPTFADPAVMHVHKDVLGEMGIPVPSIDWTTDEYMALAKRVTRDFSGDGEIDQWTSPWEPYHFSMLWNFGGDYFSQDGRRVLIDSPQAVAAAEWLRELHSAGLLGGSWAGKTAVVMPGWSSAAHFQVDPEVEYDTTWVRMPRKERYVHPWVSHAVFINPNTPHLEEAWEFVKWTASREMQERIMVPIGFTPTFKNDPELIDQFLNLGNIHIASPESFEAALPPTADTQASLYPKWPLASEVDQVFRRAIDGENAASAIIQSEIDAVQKRVDEYWARSDSDD